MESFFSLPYPEYAVALELARYFKKKKGYAITIPLSRQQQGIDLLIYNMNTRKCASIQVKSSRVWPTKKKNELGLEHFTWHNLFSVGMADFYVFFIPYPKNDFRKRLDKLKKVGKWWDFCYLLFNKSDMRKFMSGIKTKKGKPDSKFGFGISGMGDEVYLCRGSGALNRICYTEFLMKRKIVELQRLLR